MGHSNGYATACWRSLRITEIPLGKVTPSSVSVHAGSTPRILPAVTQTHKFHRIWDLWGCAANCSEFCELVMLKRIYPAARMTASLQSDAANPIECWRQAQQHKSYPTWGPGLTQTIDGRRVARKICVQRSQSITCTARWNNEGN